MLAVDVFRLVGTGVFSLLLFCRRITNSFMKGGMSSFIEASLRTLGDVGKMGGLEAVAVVAPGLTEAVVVNAEN